MTTPAVNQWDAPSNPYLVTLNGNPHITIRLRNVNRGSFRPASTTSPIRSDGTRAPQSWSNRWANLSGAIRTRTWPFVSPYFFSVTSPGYDMNLMGFVQDLGLAAAWAAGNGVFPYSVESEARTRALLKLMNNQVQLGAAAGELKETAGMVNKLCHDTVEAIDKIAKGVKKAPSAFAEFVLNSSGKKKHGRPPGWKRREAESAINNWMEYQFGIQPLVHDIHDAGQALSDSLYERNVPIVTRVKSGASETFFRTLHTPYGPQGLPAAFQIAARHVAGCHISALYEVPVSPGATLNRLGLGNPYSVAWELTQASWLVDYAVGIGDWLQTLTSAESGHLREGSISKKLVVDFPSPGGYTSVAAGATGFDPETLSGEFGRFTRDTLSLLLPAITPPLRSKLGLTQVANAVSYLTQKMYGGNTSHLR